jgi:hypothetical protein
MDSTPLGPAYVNQELNPSPTATDPPAQAIHVLDFPLPNNCEACGSNFLTANELECHKSLHHPIPKTLAQIHTSEYNAFFLDAIIEQPKEFVCRLCQKSFQSKHGLRRHFVIKHKEIYDSGKTLIQPLYLHS